MRAVRMLAGSEIRGRWRSTVALTLLLGVVGAAILATAAGARRSDSALVRFNAFSRSADVEISVGLPKPAMRRAFRRAPGVAAVAFLQSYALEPAVNPNLAIAAPEDAALGDVVDRARLIDGRRTDPRAADEITIGEALAAQLHLGVSGRLDVQSFTPAQVRAVFLGHEAGKPVGPHLRLRVVGIVRRPLDLGVRSESGGVVVLTPAFNEKYRGRVGVVSDIARVKTVAGPADVSRVVAEARRIFRGSRTFSVQGLGVEAEGAHNAVEVLTLALWIFVVVMSLAGGVAIGFVVARDMAHLEADQPTLRALGATRSQRVAALGSRALLVAIAGALLAGVGAVCASPLFPVGLARRADPDVGVHADWLVLGIGVTLVAAVVLVVTLLTARRATRPPSPALTARSVRRPSAVVDAATKAGVGPTATNGLRMAFSASAAESTVPVRSAFAGALFGLAGITVVLVFGASLAHLVATPRLSGWNWDLATEVGTDQRAKCVDADDHGLAEAPDVEALAAVCLQDLDIDGRPLTAWGFQPVWGTIDPAVVAGRAPRRSGEVALGSVTLRALGKHVGDRVRAHGLHGSASFEIVGRVVFPTIAGAQPLSDGASFLASDLVPLIDKGVNESHYLLVRSVPGTGAAELRRHVAGARRTSRTTGPATPVEIRRLQQIDKFPVILATLLATLALVAVGHTLVTSVRRRRREIALLKTIGFGRRQVAAVVAWQATMLVTVGVVVGIPIGLRLGWVVWRLVADGLGVSTSPTVPALGLVLTAVAALVLVNLIAFVPARRAARTPVAVALRSE